MLGRDSSFAIPAISHCTVITKRAAQAVNISGNAGDTFVVSGWAKGNAVPFNSDTEATREFGIIATFHYTDGTTKDFTAQFNTDVENWQYSAQPMVAEKAYSSITVTLAYDYNANTVCFDGIQLFKEAFGSSYTYDGDGNVVSVVDLQKQTTTYEYDANDNLTGVNLPTGAKLSYTYDNYHNVLTATTEEGVKYFFTYDTYGNNTSVSIGNKITSSAAYGNNGNTLLSTTDAMGKVTRYGYNANTNILEWVQYPDDTAATRMKLTYAQTFTYNKVTGSLTSMTPGNGHTIRLEYDALQRLNKVDTGSLDRYYTYRDISNTQTTSQVTELRYGTDTETFFTYTYTYDSLGNIATYSDGTDTYTYTYDGKNQLISQTGGPLDFTYTYDSAGNITEVIKDIASMTLSYTDPVWTDRLTEIHEAPITYDASGNPTSYCYSTRWKMEWEEGRNLVRIADYDGTRITCAYDQNGLRLSKDVNGVKHEYLYASGTLLREVITGTDNAVQTLDFFYDQSGRPYALNYTAGGTTTTYYYITNLQGDVLHLITADGTVTASYTYNPYGTVLTSTGNMAAVNPLRYRGYYYDSETSFYYLQSRYYDPYIGRFINADDASLLGTDGTLLSYNLFAYCGNNPVSRKDECGEFWEIVVGAAIGGAIAGAIIGTVSHLVSCGINGTDVTVSGLLEAAATGAVTGAIGAVGGAIDGVAAVASVGVGIISGVVTAINTEGSTFEKIAAGLTAGVVSGFGTYLGTKIPVATDSAFTTGFTSFSGGLFMGAQTEIVNVTTQQIVSNSFNNKSSRGKSINCNNSLSSLHDPMRRIEKAF